MSRRLRHCLTCEPSGPSPKAPFAPRRGFTRHDDRICSHCRRETDYERWAAAAGLRLEPWQLVVVRAMDSESRQPFHYPGRGGW